MVPLVTNKNDLKQSGRRRVVHQQSKTRVDSNFTQYEFLLKQHCKYFYIDKIRSTAQILFLPDHVVSWDGDTRLRLKGCPNKLT